MKHTKKILGGALLLALLASAQAAVNYVGVTTDSDTTTVIDLGNRTVRFNNNASTIVYASDAAFNAALGGTLVAASGSSPATWTWGAADTFVLQEQVFIANGDLVIEAGSIVRGQPDGGTFNPGALIICRGSKIIAAGNSGNPIIFTGAGTGPSGTVRATGSSPAWWDSAPLTAPKSPNDAGKWGGLMVLGNALTNSDRDPSTVAVNLNDIDGSLTPKTDDRFSIEGIPGTSTAFEGGYDRFGGLSSADNSGVMTYLSLRHGGANLSANNEINGLTLGAVGRGTTVSYIEIWGNTDDGIEIFGGSVNLDHVAIFGQQDDGIDLDVGYTGTIQFALVVNSPLSDKVGEWDGSYQSETSINGVTYPASGPVNAGFLPTASFTIANATFIGNSGNTAATVSGLHIRDQAAPRFVNSIVVNLGIVGTSGPVEVDNRASGANATTNMFDKEVAYLKGITFWKTGNTGPLAYTADATGYVNNGSLSNTIARAKIGAAKFENTFNVDPGFVNVPVGALSAGLLFNPVPAAAIGAAFDELVAAGQSSYAVVSYRGAFENDLPFLWTADWTAADAYQLIVK